MQDLTCLTQNRLSAGGASSRTMTSHVKRAIESRNHPLGTWISIGYPAVVEIVAQLDLNSILVDMDTPQCPSRQSRNWREASTHSRRTWSSGCRGTTRSV